MTNGTPSRIVANSLGAALAAWLAWSLQPAAAEKVMFHDEVTGCEMWRLSSFPTFHGYPPTGGPFSEEGLWAATQAFDRKAIAAINLADGREVLIGRGDSGEKTHRVFLHRSGRTALIYDTELQDPKTKKAEFLLSVYDLATHQDRCILRIPKRFGTTLAGVIGPASQYAQLQGDLTGDAEVAKWPLAMPGRARRTGREGAGTVALSRTPRR
jgi:hypothetical protein